VQESLLGLMLRLGDKIWGILAVFDPHNSASADSRLRHQPAEGDLERKECRWV